MAFLLEAYKEDGLKEVIPTSPTTSFWRVGSYATTVRRRALDFAVKVVSAGGEIILKVTKALMDNLKSFHVLYFYYHI